MVESSLHELGYATTIVTSAEHALALLRDDPEPYAAVFSDVVLPGMTGIDLGRALARLQIDIPVVLTSGYSHVLAQESDHGFLLLPKPYALDDLARLLHEAVLRRDRAASVAKVSTTHAITLVETAFGQAARAPDEGVERVRLAELTALHIMDTEEEAAYDELTHLASAFCQTPIALVSLVDDERQWFKARVGLQARETPREHAFCSYAIEQPEQIMQVVDATLDARFVRNPLVTGDPGIRFYAGAPLVTSTGQALGTLCVIDTEPRKLTVHQLDALRLLAARVIERLEARRVALNLGAPRDSEP
jgi:CheY-like chemotaxis protein